MDNRNELLLRVYIVMLLFVIVAVAIVWKAVDISIVNQERWESKLEENLKWMPVKAERGAILADDAETQLVASIKFFEIRMDPYADGGKKETKFNQYLNEFCHLLAKYGDDRRSVSEWKSYIKKYRKKAKQGQPGTRYLLVAKRVDFDVKRILQQSKMCRELKVLRFIDNLHRVKPYGDVAARTLGLHRGEYSVGLEDYYDVVLTGDEDQMLMRKVGGNWIPDGDIDGLVTKKGDDLVTTIDADLQSIVHAELLKGVTQWQAEAGVAILMDVKTGGIKACSNLEKTINGSYRELYNRAIGRLSEPGSTFKLATVLALLESNQVDRSTLVDLQGGAKDFYDLTMKDSENHGLRIVDFKKAFEMSSNVGIATLALDVFGSKSQRVQFYNYLDQFGLTKMTEVDIKGEKLPNIKHPIRNKKNWNLTSLPWMAHGYEMQVTPLQMLNLYNAVANDGRLMKPHFVKEIRRGSEIVKNVEPVTLNEKIASPATIEEAQKFLLGAVEKGTGSKYVTEEYRFAGKTGTSSVNYGRLDVEKSHNGSFVGYFPAENPRYSMIIVMYKPQGNYYGSKVALPVFRNIADKCYSIDRELMEYMAVDKPMVNQSIEDASGFAGDFEEILTFIDANTKIGQRARWVNLDVVENQVILDKKKIIKKKVPDVQKMGLQDAMYVLNNVGIQVVPHGTGKVYKQSLRPGTEVQGQTMEIYLN